jgi:hypothetical protein
MKVTKLLRDRRGFMFILLAAGLMLVLCAFAGLALDVSRAYVVKGQLQNAADASALAGAANLYDLTKTPATLTWSAASKAASDFIAKNSADGKTLSDCLVDTGYWNLKGASNQTLVPSSSPPAKPGLCEASGSACANDTDCPKVGGKPDYCFQVYIPAVKVTADKSAGNNNGAVQTFFAKLLGWNQFEPGASGVAFSGFPGSAPPGTTFPFAVTEALKEDFLNKTGIFADGKVHDITFTTAIDTSQGSMLPGLWTDLLQTNTSDSVVQGYINYLIDPNGKKVNAAPEVHVGQTINLTNGANNKLYQLTQNLIDAGKRIVYVPVVQSNLDPKKEMQVKGFAKIELVVSNDPVNSFIGHFLGYESSAPPGAGPGGVPSNVVTPPKMVQ